ncbi:melanotransferrin, partial [Asbolus verrucosus]
RSDVPGQNFWKNQIHDGKPQDRRIKIIWCTISIQEQHKCNNFAMANERDKIRVGSDYFKIECIQAFNKDECMSLLDEEKATITTLDAGEVFIGGRFNSLVPIAQEVLDDGSRYYYAVAAIKKGTLSHVQSLHDLRGVQACFAGVETFAGWVVPIYTLMTQGGMDIVDCNNHVKSATRYFGPSCAVNCLSNKYNPIGDNSDKLCHLCIGKIPGGWCGSSDPYAGFEGAFRCLLETGDIAFLRHTTIPQLLKGDQFISITKEGFELLCKDGSRRSVDDYLSCNWGKVPTDAIVTTSASSFEKRRKYQLFLEKAAKLYNNQTQGFNPNQNNYNNREPEYDQFGNRVNRYKRQNFGNFGGNDQNQYGQNNDNRYDPNRQDDNRYPYRQDSDQYGRNDNQYGDRNQPPNDPFVRDPFTINRDQFGVNIDPYQDPYNRNRDPFNFNNSLQPTYDNQNNTFYEVFNLFESSPRYGIRHNLLFQDSTRGFASVNENQQTYSTFLENSMNIIMGIRDCQ